MKLIKLVFIGILFSLLSSCGARMPNGARLQTLMGQHGKVFLKNKKVVEGVVSILERKGVVKIKNQSFSPESVEKVTFYNPKHPEKHYTLRYKTIKMITKRDLWVLHRSFGEHVDAFVVSRSYTVDENGDLKLIGVKTFDGRYTTQPVFGIGLQKKNDEFVKGVGLLKTKGVIFADSTFRRGVCKRLKDDPELCEYIKQNKLGIDDVDEIVRLYNPNRGNEPITK